MHPSINWFCIMLMPLTASVEQIIKRQMSYCPIRTVFQLKWVPKHCVYRQDKQITSLVKFPKFTTAVMLLKLEFKVFVLNNQSENLGKGRTRKGE